MTVYYKYHHQQQHHHKPAINLRWAKMVQDGPVSKMAQDDPRWLKMGQSGPSLQPRWPSHETKWAPQIFRWAARGAVARAFGGLLAEYVLFFSRMGKPGGQGQAALLAPNHEPTIRPSCCQGDANFDISWGSWLSCGCAIERLMCVVMR